MLCICKQGGSSLLHISNISFVCTSSSVPTLQRAMKKVEILRLGVKCSVSPYSDLGFVSRDFWVVDQQNSVHTFDDCRPARLKPACVRAYMKLPWGVAQISLLKWRTTSWEVVSDGLVLCHACRHSVLPYIGLLPKKLACWPAAFTTTTVMCCYTTARVVSKNSILLVIGHRYARTPDL